MDVGKPCVDLYARESSKGQRQREEKMRKKKRKKDRCERRIERRGGGEKIEVGGIIRIVFQKCEKKKKGRRGYKGIGIFSPNFLYFFFLSSFSGKNRGKRCSHPIDFIVHDLTSSPLLASLSTNV